MVKVRFPAIFPAVASRVAERLTPLPLPLFSCRFSFVGDPQPASDPLFEPIICQHKSTPRADFVMSASGGDVIVAGGFGAHWTVKGGGAMGE